MSIQTECVSSCCGAKIRTGGGDDKHPLACTHYHVCEKCGQPCNWKAPNKETLQALKDSREGNNLTEYTSVDELMRENWK